MPMMIRNWGSHDFLRKSVTIWVYCPSWNKAGELYCEAMGRPFSKAYVPSPDFRNGWNYRPLMPAEWEYVERHGGPTLRSSLRDKMLADNPNKIFYEWHYAEGIKPLDAEAISILRAPE